MNILFSRSNHTLEIKIYTDKTRSKEESTKIFDAYNNTTRDTKPWEPGTYEFCWHSPHKNEDENSSYGSNGNFIFNYTNRSGMGIHSGRKNKNGIKHVTKGCIRTSDEATLYHKNNLNKMYMACTLTVEE
ncbi:hypothetical protein M0812_00291 [Anaeramoeba flamelloides]|uniref:YkuD domain-containing protein n=1 Tax=Anaeramoeba flamelloides TaxID=1746091 RepID=A0AAV8A0M5_9EUKA|nr:hypothetical protein M0812_00291 [Anaeramoeba flamelloides]